MTGALQTLRPFAWLALIAFLVGFFSYVALHTASGGDMAPRQMQPLEASGPVSDDWKMARHI